MTAPLQEAPTHAAPELSTASRHEAVLTDSQLLDLASDYRYTYQHGGTTFDEFDALGFARALLALAARAAPALALTDEQRQVLQFLYGIGELDGCGFGGRPSGERGLYWWRKHLHTAFPECAEVPTPTPKASRPTPEKASKT